MILKFVHDEIINQPDKIGGKAFHLGWLSKNGYNLPSWCVIPYSYFSSPNQNELTREIEEWMKVNHIHSVAVRSSGQGEDGNQNSFAGQFSSYLNVRNIGSIQKKIDRCHNSALSSQNQSYLKAKNLNAKKPDVSVILQNMVVGEKSGVLFTANPQNSSRSEYILSASFGLCEGVVNGQSDCDEWVIDSLDGNIIKKNKIKKEYVVLPEEKGQKKDSSQ